MLGRPSPLAQPNRGSWLSRESSCAAPCGLVELMTLASRHIDPADNWETASHFYLLLAASRHDWPIVQQPELTSQAQAMRRGLSLPAGFDSPRYELRHPIGPELNREEMTQRIRLFVDTLNGVIVHPPASELPGQMPPPVRVRNGSSTSAQSPASAPGVSDGRDY